jgi:hypothetical protein
MSIHPTELRAYSIGFDPPSPVVQHATTTPSISTIASGVFFYSSAAPGHTANAPTDGPPVTIAPPHHTTLFSGIPEGRTGLAAAGFQANNEEIAPPPLSFRARAASLLNQLVNAADKSNHFQSSMAALTEQLQAAQRVVQLHAAEYARSVEHAASSAAQSAQKLGEERVRSAALTEQLQAAHRVVQLQAAEYARSVEQAASIAAQSAQQLSEERVRSAALTAQLQEACAHEAEREASEARALAARNVETSTLVAERDAAEAHVQRLQCSLASAELRAEAAEERERAVCAAREVQELAARRQLGEVTGTLVAERDSAEAHVRSLQCSLAAAEQRTDVAERLQLAEAAQLLHAQASVRQPQAYAVALPLCAGALPTSAEAATQQPSARREALLLPSLPLPATARVVALPGCPPRRGAGAKARRHAARRDAAIAREACVLRGLRRVRGRHAALRYTSSSPVLPLPPANPRAAAQIGSALARSL